MSEENNKERFIGTKEEYNFINKDSSNNIIENIKNRQYEEMINGMNKYMPIGSVVKVFNSEKLIMIIGFNYSNDVKKYDYIGCEYPYGIDINHGTMLFNHDEIDRVYYVGFINNLEKKMKKDMLEESKNK